MGTKSDASSYRPEAIEACSPALNQSIDEFADFVDRHARFVVVAHESPDGDAVGSTLAMANVLAEQGKEVVVYNQDPVPYNFQFLPGANRWQTDLGDEGPFDATIVLDCCEPSRLGPDFPDAGWGEEVAVVDHHKTWDSEFADVYVRDVEAAATGEILYRFASRFGEPSMDVAENLYCCMMTDTGSFRYSNTSRTAFRIAGELVEIGVEPWKMTSEIYENQPRERLELLCDVLGTLSMSSCGRLAFLRVDQEMVDDVGSDEDLTDGFINYARSIRGVEVATQLRERDDGVWRISFRSRGRVDVSRLAEEYGGGGHHNAAGCVIDEEPDRIEEMLGDTLRELLDREEG